MERIAYILTHYDHKKRQCLGWRNVGRSTASVDSWPSYLKIAKVIDRGGAWRKLVDLRSATFNKPRIDKQLEELRRRSRIFHTYLVRQTFADLRNVNQIFLSEEVVKDPLRLLALPIPQNNRLGLIESAADSVAKELPKTIPIYDIDSHLPHARVRAVVVMIPSKMVRWLEGTPAQRRFFDAVIHHEVRGHASDYHNLQSDFWEFFNTTFSLTKSIAVAREVTNDAEELGAYLVELDRLITTFNYDRNPSVLPKDKKVLMEKTVVFHLTRILRMLELRMVVEDRRRFQQLLKAYVLKRIGKVSARTRHHVRKLVKASGWTRPLPF